MARLLTVLGLGKYEPVSYYMVADPARSYETAYAPVATAALAGAVADVAVLVTAQAREKHWEGCSEAFAGLGVPARAIDIPAGTTEDETWQVFAAILDAVAGEEEVVLDVTFSFRHLPFVLLASLTYLTALRRVKVRGVYYGAYDAGRGGRVPIVDLAPLLTLADWYHAVRTFADTGNPRRLAEALQKGERQVVERFGPEPSRNHLRRALQGLAWSLPSGLPLEAGLEAGRAMAAVDAVLAGPSRVPIVNTVMRPLGEILREFAVPEGTSGKAGIVLDHAELSRQLRLARLYSDRGQADRALLVLREWLINRCLLSVGDLRGQWLNYGEARRPMEAALNALAARRQLDGDGSGADLARVWKQIADRRNAIAHAGFRIEAVGDAGNVARRLIDECESRVADDAIWRTAVPGRLGRLLVTPLGLSAGVLFSALQGLQPDAVLVLTSRETEGQVPEARDRAGWTAGSLDQYVVADAHRCFEEVGRVLDWARPALLQAGELLVNVTGGTTAMQYVVERVAGEAVRLGVPTSRYALLDRRSPEEQRRAPYVLGEVVPLRGDEPIGGD